MEREKGPRPRVPGTSAWPTYAQGSTSPLQAQDGEGQGCCPRPHNGHARPASPPSPLLPSSADLQSFPPFAPGPVLPGRGDPEVPIRGGPEASVSLHSLQSSSR